MTGRRRAGAATPALALGLALLGSACGPGTAPEVTAGPDGVVDPVLVAGRDIYVRRCASCHGVAGGGGRGPQLDGGAVLEAYPEIEDQLELVAEGEGGMPAFGDVLGDEELVAVVRYSREVLAER